MESAWAADCASSKMVLVSGRSSWVRRAYVFRFEAHVQVPHAELALGRDVGVEHVFHDDQLQAQEDSFELELVEPDVHRL